MKQKSKRVYFLTTLLVIFVCFPATAYAYIDPGAGSMILQLLGIGFIAAGGIWVTFKNRIAFFFRKGKGKSGDHTDPVQQIDNQAKEDKNE